MNTVLTGTAACGRCNVILLVQKGGGPVRTNNATLLLQRVEEQKKLMAASEHVLILTCFSPLYIFKYLFSNPASS